MIIRVVGFIGAIAGLYGYLVPQDFPNSQIYAAILGLALFLIYAATEIYTFIIDRDFVCKSDETNKINREMNKIIATPGRTTILSRDLSWASDTAITSLLSEKAKRNELTIHLQNQTALSEKLRNDGAVIVYYDATGFVPESRFTMMNTGQPHATIAIGFVRNGKRVIRRYRNGEEASFHLAEDLLRLLDIAVARSAHA